VLVGVHTWPCSAHRYAFQAASNCAYASPLTA
jgi:hypothetical protein